MPQLETVRQRLRKLIGHFGSLTAAWRAGPFDLARAGLDDAFRLHLPCADPRRVQCDGIHGHLRDRDGQLPDGFRVIGVSRSDADDEAYRAMVRDALEGMESVG